MPGESQWMADLPVSFPANRGYLMACVNPDGTVSESATAILKAIQSPLTPEQIAQATSLPLFRIRSGLREMMEAELAVEREGYFEISSSGKVKIG